MLFKKGIFLYGEGVLVDSLNIKSCTCKLQVSISFVKGESFLSLFIMKIVPTIASDGYDNKTLMAISKMMVLITKR